MFSNAHLAFHFICHCVVYRTWVTSVTI